MDFKVKMIWTTKVTLTFSKNDMDRTKWHWLFVKMIWTAQSDIDFLQKWYGPHKVTLTFGNNDMDHLIVTMVTRLSIASSPMDWMQTWLWFKVEANRKAQHWMDHCCQKSCECGLGWKCLLILPYPLRKPSPWIIVEQIWCIMCKI